MWLPAPQSELNRNLYTNVDILRQIYCCNMGQTDDRGVCEMFVVNQEEIQKALSIINAKRTEADIKAFNDINKIGNMINLVNYSIRYFGEGMALVLKLRHEYEEVNIIENANTENVNIENVKIKNGVCDNEGYREYIEDCLESNYYAILSSVINRNERG